MEVCHMEVDISVLLKFDLRLCCTTTWCCDGNEQLAASNKVIQLVTRKGSL